MVKQHCPPNRSAFTMIELIFAIVVIAISVISLPTMIQTTSKGIESNIVQEAIFASEAILNESTTYYWDKQSMDDENVSGGYSRVINTGDCLGAGVPYKRKGHINRQCLDNNTTTPLNNYYSDSVENVTHVYNNVSIFETNTAGTGVATYKTSYSATATVTNCGYAVCNAQFGQEANNKNIKEIQIKITPTGTPTDTLILLRAYVSNIGEVKTQSRIF